MYFCPLYSGSSGNAAYLKTAKACLLIDAGKSMRDIERALEAIGARHNRIDGILVTHEHSDHIKSAGSLSRKYSIPIYANEATFSAMEGKIGPVSLKNIRTFCTGQDFFIQDICIHPYAIPHDAAEPVGYCFYNGGSKISMMTDLGHVPDKLLDVVEKSNLLLLESNHDLDMLAKGPYPQYLKTRIAGRKGHLSNLAAAQALLKLKERGLGQVILGHLSETNNTAATAVKTVYSVLGQNGVELELLVSGQRPGAYRILREALNL